MYFYLFPANKLSVTDAGSCQVPLCLITDGICCCCCCCYYYYYYYHHHFFKYYHYYRQSTPLNMYKEIVDLMSVHVSVAVACVQLPLLLLERGGGCFIQSR